MPNTVNIIANQTLLDIALQTAGSLEAVFELAILNGITVTENLTAGNKLFYGLTPINKTITKQYTEAGWKPASATSFANDIPDLDLQGVDYWNIGGNFIIQ